MTKKKKSENETNTWLTIAAIFIAVSTVVAYVVHSRLKNAQLETERTLKEDLVDVSKQIIGGTEGTYELVISGWHHPGFVVDERGEITFANYAAEQLFFTKGVIFDHAPKEIAKKHLEYLQRYAHSSNAVTTMMQNQKSTLIDKHGTEIPVQVIAWLTPLRPARFVLQVVPLTEPDKKQ